MQPSSPSSRGDTKKRPSRGATLRRGFSSTRPKPLTSTPTWLTRAKAHMASWRGTREGSAASQWRRWRPPAMPWGWTSWGATTSRYACPQCFFKKHRTHHMQVNRLSQLMLTNSPGGRPFKHQAQCPQVIESCLELASPTRGRRLAGSTATPLHTHSASKQGERVMIIILRHLFVY